MKKVRNFNYFETENGDMINLKYITEITEIEGHIKPKYRDFPDSWGVSLVGEGVMTRISKKDYEKLRKILKNQK